jgi:hypothetical protein
VHHNDRDDPASDIAKKKFKVYPIGSLHIEIAEVQTGEGKLYLFVAIDRTSKFALVKLHEKATTKSSAFLRRVIAAVPYKIHTVLTDNGIQFTTPGAGGSASVIKEAMATGELFRAHAIELTCAKNDIDTRLIKPKQPWTSQVERINRIVNEATAQRLCYESYKQLPTPCCFVAAYNFDRILKTLRDLMPFEHIYKIWTSQPE